MLKKIFSAYSSDKKGTKVLIFRKLCQLAKNFSLFNTANKLDEAKLQLLFLKKVPQKAANFRDFIDILYTIVKLSWNKAKKFDKVKAFKNFLDQIIVPKYKMFLQHLIQFNIDEIQVFYKDYNPYENPTLLLLYENENLFKHVVLIFNFFF